MTTYCPYCDDMVRPIDGNCPECEMPLKKKGRVTHSEDEDFEFVEESEEEEEAILLDTKSERKK